MALRGKTAVVTGAAQGLGKGFACALLKNGAKVALLDVNESLGKEVKCELDKEYGAENALFIACDVASDAQMQAAFQKAIAAFKRIDIVCNNAGISNEKDWGKTVAINLCGVVRGTYLALEHMKKQNGGRGGLIINVASLAGLGPFALCPIYTATKHGVVGFSRALADSSAICDYGVRINILCPSFARTAILGSLSYFEDAPLLVSDAEKLMQKFDVLEVSDVVEAFMQMVTEEDRNGHVMVVMKGKSVYGPLPGNSSDLFNSSQA